METRLIDRLSRMRDLSPAETDYNLSIAAQAERCLSEAGFQRLDTPVVERTDLFVRKSGGEVSSSLYTFLDPGGISVSLRPEFTPSVIRWFIENRPDQDRFCYSGPVFRYGGTRGGRFRQFHQVGGELLGVSGAAGDSEILSVAHRCLEAGGVDRLRTASRSHRRHKRPSTRGRPIRADPDVYGRQPRRYRRRKRLHRPAS